jgi:hypothetical protein
MRLAGLLLLIVGAFSLLFGGIRYTLNEPITGYGPVDTETGSLHRTPITPLFGALVFTAGAALLFLNRRGPRQFR